MLIRELCKEKKDELNYTNQDIAIATHMPADTVKRYFSGISKSPSVYTVGPICAVLGVSLDKYFGISAAKPDESLGELSALQEQYKTLKSDMAHTAFENKREADHNQRLINQLLERLKNQKIFSLCLLIILGVLLFLFVAYLICFDIPNPNYGIFRSEAFM